MDFQITAAEAFHYHDHTDGITLPVKLSSGDYKIEALAKVDGLTRRLDPRRQRDRVVGHEGNTARRRQHHR